MQRSDVLWDTALMRRRVVQRPCLQLCPTSTTTHKQRVPRLIVSLSLTHGCTRPADPSEEASFVPAWVRPGLWTASMELMPHKTSIGCIPAESPNHHLITWARPAVWNGGTSGRACRPRGVLPHGHCNVAWLRSERWFEGLSVCFRSMAVTLATSA